MHTSSFKLTMQNRLPFFLMLSALLFTYAESSLAKELQKVEVLCYAPAYVGKEISFSAVVDYITHTEEVLATAVVQKDSSCTVKFEVSYTQRINIKADIHSSFMYVEPEKKYTIYIPKPNPKESGLVSGSRLELTFLDLDTTDINYKILQFQFACDKQLTDNYYMKYAKPKEFDAAMKRFRDSISINYDRDSSIFFKVFVRYTFATLDEMNHPSSRPAYEKFEFYINKRPIFYENDIYMEYFNDFYDLIFTRLDYETSDSVNTAIQSGSAKKLMIALGNEPMLVPFPIRELAMIKGLAQEYRSGYLPKKNILLILDSVAKGSKLPQHRIIARNVIDKLIQVNPGAPAPPLFFMNDSGDTLKTLKNFDGKHIYIHFYDPSTQKSKLELPPLIKLYEKYKNDVHFVSLYPKKTYSASDSLSFIAPIPWEKYVIDPSSSTMNNYKVSTFPTYVLIDAIGHVVSAPALGPMPNGTYMTIDFTFFKIQEMLKKQNEKRDR
jgi:hypothetical protein